MYFSSRDWFGVVLFSCTRLSHTFVFAGTLPVTNFQNSAEPHSEGLMSAEVPERQKGITASHLHAQLDHFASKVTRWKILSKVYNVYQFELHRNKY